MGKAITKTDNALNPYEVGKLNEAGIDTSTSEFYWKAIDFSNADPNLMCEKSHEMLRKPSGYVRQKGEMDAPTYAELLTILPRYINKGDHTYFRTEMTDKGGTVMAYCTNHINDILHSEYHVNPNLMAYQMILWCHENGYLNEEEK